MLISKHRITQIFRLTSSTFAIQIVIQFIGMVIGFYIVRTLTINEYAYYTIANTILGMMAVISNCGISISVYSQGAKVWKNREELGAVVVSGIDFRKKFAILAIITCFPVLIYMLERQNASVLTIIIISVTIIPAFISTLTDSLYEIVPKLHQELRPLQLNQLFVAILRLLLTGMFLILFPFTWVAVLMSGIPRVLGNIRLRKIVLKNADLSQKSNKIIEDETKRIVKRFAPGAIYYAFSGQIVLFILAHIGNINNTAAWGALGRFSIVFTTFLLIIDLIFIPRYARLEQNKFKILLTSSKILLLVVFFGGIVMSLFFLFSEVFLNILGGNYNNLKLELLMTMFNSFLIIFGSIVLNFSVSRGWIIHPAVDLFINIFPLVFFAFLIPLNSLLNIILYSIYCSMFCLFGRYFCFLYQLYKIK